MKKIPSLPKSDDEYWEEAEKYPGSPTFPSKICPTHTKDNWTTHKGYADNHDGTISCKFCDWGCYLPGYMKLYNGGVFDLREG